MILFEPAAQPCEENMNGSFRAALALSLAIVISSVIVSSTFLKAKRLDQTITVTGSSKKRIKSDLMIWGTSVTAEAPKLADAYTKLTQDVEKVRAFLVAQGFSDNTIVISAVSTTQLRHVSKVSVGEVQPYGGGPVASYRLTQSLEIRSPEIDKLTKVSRSVTQLINQGILLESDAPKYLYTHLSETKVEMLAEAAHDARERAQQIANSNGGKAGEMRSAQMGVLQVTAADSTQFSGEGMNDTTSLEKDITAVVHATFAID
jgi:hypothetical protein